jgi:hypothetical protein
MALRKRRAVNHQYPGICRLQSYVLFLEPSADPQTSRSMHGENNA